MKSLLLQTIDEQPQSDCLTTENQINDSYKEKEQSDGLTTEPSLYI